MKDDEYLLNLMRQVDGPVDKETDGSTSTEVKELKALLTDLRALSLEKPDADTDQQFSKFLQTNKQASTSVLIKQWWPVLLVAASLVLILYLFIPEKLSSRYESIASNPDKISFIHELNNKKLSKEELTWLVSLFEDEEHPNIRLVLIDLIENQGIDFPEEVSGYLVNERTPVVQMALLNSIDYKVVPEMKEKLLAFNNRKDLDPLVQLRVREILNQH